MSVSGIWLDYFHFDTLCAYHNMIYYHTSCLINSDNGLFSHQTSNLQSKKKEVHITIMKHSTDIFGPSHCNVAHKRQRVRPEVPVKNCKTIRDEDAPGYNAPIWYSMYKVCASSTSDHLTTKVAGTIVNQDISTGKLIDCCSFTSL